MNPFDRHQPAATPATRIRGAFTALVTPFDETGGIDDAALARLLAHQLAGGIDGLVPCGTTGESPTLAPAERERVIEAAVRAAAEWRPAQIEGSAGIPTDTAVSVRPVVVAGTGTNDTAATIRATRRAAELGADAALVVTPYYNRPDQRMLAAHFTAVADDGGLPIVVYNVPSRTGSNVEADTALRLAEHPRVVAVKEASGNLEQIATIIRDRPAGFSVMAGDDAWTLAVLAMGGDGVISVASNEIPAEMVALCAAARDGDWARARLLHDRWLPLFRANFRGGPNPVPVKAALAMMGIVRDGLRMPLLVLDGPARDRLEALLDAEGLLPVAPALAAGHRARHATDGAGPASRRTRRTVTGRASAGRGTVGTAGTAGTAGAAPVRSVPA